VARGRKRAEEGREGKGDEKNREKPEEICYHLIVRNMIAEAF
jgi:hypothetical protein